MGNLADSSILASDMTATDNPTVLLPTECIQIADPKIQKTHVQSDPVAQMGGTSWGRTSFKSLDELYTYLKENGGLSVQEEVEQSQNLKSPADSTKQKQPK